MKMPNLVVVLVEPQGALNIGSVCRSMMNFGASDLRLVNPQVDPFSEDARKMALKASSLLETARLCTSLEEALADCGSSYGTTRRFGRYRREFLVPEQAAREAVTLLPDVKVALVFGREDSGLRTSELDCCRRLLTIPTDEDFASLNLAQAVTVCLYEMARVARNPAQVVIESSRKPASGEEMEALFAHMREVLASSGFLNPQNPDHLMHTFRRMLDRCGLNSREVRIWRGLWRHVAWLNDGRAAQVSVARSGGADVGEEDARDDDGGSCRLPGGEGLVEQQSARQDGNDGGDANE